ncbi:MAG: phytanoyl-CoA dioxygenase family protein [Candidatus Binatia bacterium]
MTTSARFLACASFHGAEAACYTLGARGGAVPLPAGFSPIDFRDYHAGPLSGLLAGERGRAAGRAAAHLGSLAFCVGGSAVTYRPDAGGIALAAGDDDADTIIELDLLSWQGFAHDLEAPAGLLYAGRARCRRGNAAEFMAWETPLRALYHGRRPYHPDCSRLTEPDGGRLDCGRVFTLADDRAAMRQFLSVAGYLFVRGVFAAAEVAALRAEAAALKGEARQGDKLSWWGRTAGGDEVLCRVTRGCTKPHLAALRDDARLLGLTDLTDEPLVYRRGEGDGVAVIYKHPGIAEGLGDLPWHRDCGLGGHAIACPTAIASVYLSEATAASGELVFLPGSRHTAFNAHDPQCRGELPAAHFAAQPGDVTFHYGDTVHAAPPPADPTRVAYRISAILGYARPDARHHRGEGSYNDVLHGREDGQVDSPVSVARRR